MSANLSTGFHIQNRSDSVRLNQKLKTPITGQEVRADTLVASGQYPSLLAKAAIASCHH